MPYRIAVRIWTIALVAAVAAFAILFPIGRREVVIAAVAASTPLWGGIFGQGQDDALLLAVLACGLFLRAKSHEFLAGMVLSLLAIKFHLFALLPILLIVKRERKMLFGIAAGSAALGAISFAVAGPAWVRSYLALAASAQASSRPEMMPNLRGLAMGHPAIEVVACVLIAAVCFVSIERSRFEIGLAVALIGGILISHHAYTADLAMLVPALLIFICGDSTPAVKLFAMCLLTPPMTWASLLGIGALPALALSAFLVTVAIGIVRRPSCNHKPR